MKKRRFATTYSKMTAAFIGFGLVPLLLLSLLFYARYNVMLQNSMLSSYSTRNGYVTRLVGDVVHSVDDAMGELYDYQTATGESLALVLKGEIYEPDEREQDIQNVLRAVMFKSKYISGLRFVDYRGNIYSMYYSQEKILKNGEDSHATMSIYNEGDSLTSAKYLGTIPESEICINSDDYVFSIVRNFMDTTTVSSTYTKAMGTLYADINVKDVADIVQKADLDKGHYYVFLKDDSRYIYSDNGDDFLNGADPLGFCKEQMEDDMGYLNCGKQWVFYEKIQDTDIYGVLVIDKMDVMGKMFQSRALLILILCFASAFLLLLYQSFSNRMSEPTRKLKDAMDAVKDGNLDVRVDLNTNDELEYVADGFNSMVEQLGNYIEQAYVAKICQKDAELTALKMQIQPHYLYNTLDVIRMTALDHDDIETARLLESLARQLRYVMGEQSDRVTIREELDAIREYFVIMKARYEGRISLMISVEDKDCELVVLKMLLQPLVENAIRHGLRDKEGPGAVAICVNRKADYLEIIVMDDGVGIEENSLNYIQNVLEDPKAECKDLEGRISVGMKNVYDRIKLNCGAEYGFHIQSTRGVGTIVTYKLPIWEEL